jgi:sentrin-specific protease 7
MLSPKPSTGVQDILNEDVDDDVNLFDERLSLVDREDTGIHVHSEPETNQASLLPHSSRIEPTDAKTVPTGILSQTTTSLRKHKAKRKPAQPKRDPSQPIILILDSLPGVARSGTVRALKDWLTAEGETKRGMEVEIKERGYYPKASQIPMQNNYTDCGVYLLGYVEKFFQNPDEFKNKLLTGSMSAEEDWPELKPEDMRSKMREIIFGLHEQQELERKSSKIKKGVTKSKTLPAQPLQGPMEPETRAPLTKHVSSQEAQIGIGSGKHEDAQQLAAEQNMPHSESGMQPTGLRLASPFEFDRKPAGSDSDIFSDTVGKVSDSPPGAASPIKSSFVSPRPGRTPRPSNPEVRIPVKTPQSHTSVRGGQAMSCGTACQQGELRRMGHAPHSLSPTKRLIPHADDTGLPAAKTQSPREQGRDRNILASANREGSAPSMPIEVEDSQEANPTISRYFPQSEAVTSAQRKPPSRSGRPKPSLRQSSSVEETERPSPKRKHRQSEETFPGRALEDRLDDDNYEREQSRRSKAPAPLSSLNRTEEAELDSAEEISQSTSRMQLDGADDAVVRETPEPARRSPDAHGTWSRTDPLPL